MDGKAKKRELRPDWVGPTLKPPIQDLGWFVPRKDRKALERIRDEFRHGYTDLPRLFFAVIVGTTGRDLAQLNQDRTTQLWKRIFHGGSRCWHSHSEGSLGFGRWSVSSFGSATDRTDVDIRLAINHLDRLAGQVIRLLNEKFKIPNHHVLNVHANDGFGINNFIFLSFLLRVCRFPPNGIQLIDEYQVFTSMTTDSQGMIQVPLGVPSPLGYRLGFPHQCIFALKKDIFEASADLLDVMLAQHRPALSGQALRAYENIMNRPGQLGEEIAKKIGCKSPSAFRTHVVPKLKACGIKNKGHSRGYYPPESP